MCTVFMSDPISDIVVQQTDFDVTTRRCVVSDRNLASAILYQTQDLSEGEVKVVITHSN